MIDIRKLIADTTEFFAGDAKRIQHFIKVRSLANLVGGGEGMTDNELNVLDAAAVVHDVGIRPAEEKYGRCDGKLQEKEGPAVARPLLEGCGATEEQIDRICFLIAHHHTYSDMNGLDYQVLVEADYLVNILEDGITNLNPLREKIFRTNTGKFFLDWMYKDLEDLNKSK